MNEGPIVVQGDKTVLLEVEHKKFAEARDILSGFAELLKSPEHFHTYQISALSLWNAASAGRTPAEVVDKLTSLSRYPVPLNVTTDIHAIMGRYGKIKIKKIEGSLYLETFDPLLMVEIVRHKKIRPYLLGSPSETRVAIDPMSRGFLKMELARLGYPAEDLAGYIQGASLPCRLRSVTSENKPLTLRPYQREAAQAFYAGGTEKGGSGIVVLPCGAGKTLVGMKVMEDCQCHTLIVTTNIVAARQWIAELLDKSHLSEDQVGEYNGAVKTIRPVTVATYQILTYRKRKENRFPHFEIFEKNSWGLIIYDEVHLLPAPLFRVSAEMQATRRLGLTATLIREDQKETDVFSLIGPKKYDVPWKILEQQGWIAQALCTEIRVPMNTPGRVRYAMATPREKVTLSSTNPLKDLVVKELLAGHKTHRVLIIGQYLDQLNSLAAQLKLPLLTGKTKNEERLKYFQWFREGEITTLMVSKIGNFAVDLPDANVLIQISGTFGSRQEEAQRLGRLLRPKSDGSIARFFSLVTRDSREQEFAMNRQLFLAEQGYEYVIEDWAQEDRN